MTLAVWFWLFYVLSLVFGLWEGYVPGGIPWLRCAWFTVLYVLLGIIGWKLSGSPVQ